MNATFLLDGLYGGILVLQMQCPLNKYGYGCHASSLVTNHEYLRFLNELIQSGRQEEAKNILPENVPASIWPKAQ